MAAGLNFLSFIVSFRSTLLEAYPQLTSGDIRAALAYAAEVTRERIIPLPTCPDGVKFKLDENLDARLASLVAEGGHKADSAVAEGLRGKPGQGHGSNG
ncbi:MAG: hypothetical protein HYY78_02465 [Betaproteobacteria bacterium]|nr:hypothetical protein [Betaproteobacteria bacterium]